MPDVTPRFKSPKKANPKATAKKCDEMFSKIIRVPGFCRICGTTEFLQCAHGFSRSYRPTRWDERNAFCLCRGCHMKYTVDPIGWDDLLHSWWGEPLYAELKALAVSHEPRRDFKVLSARLRARLGELELA